ncbi:phage shock protein C, PspC [Pseudarthrobacter chlorophenolicus A6]|uniref:Phage shock protein C, PspC n=1 Tax=Pseudarthrobacter chlorophenolicus (strain ATCC 700700 / DSM 12829 / CIP 107037 / JCM 12360 / KCTC 9906 / NCIMB 13794 / A6) TaxID=452863 RepID=B8HD31_PSECP|nr:PspC domain-containing protein [Pseudarthrobacter chlorophenolicus]ACL40677.1 phage shock protein C, PspC [Pseudarthrobacter chlorophenolicus A6]SDQ77108.1 Phage shock protein PspC (stress-responsive transcriptional regulator) [Pseudarthrobacter chlorophenolicus]
MNSQTSLPDDGQPTEPLPGAPRPTEPLPSAPTTPDPSEGPQASGSSQPGADQAYAGRPGTAHAAPGEADFFSWIRGHGIQRGRDRWIGGVSSGIAQKLGVDPLIIRGVFIVLTLFAGIGVLVYGLAWALLPEPDGRIHVQEAAAGRWTTGMTGSLIATILGLTGLGGGFWGWSHNGFGGFLWTVFWVGGAIYLIYYLSQRNKAGRPAMAAPHAGAYGTPGGYGTPGEAGASGATYAAGPGTAPFSSTGTSYGAGPASPSMPSYGGGSYSDSGSYSGGGSGAGGGFQGGGPYGGAPAPQRTPKPRPAGPGAPAVAVAAGSALLVGGGLKALDVTNVIDLGDSANAIVWASAAAVLGLGILIAGLRGRTAGVLSFFAVVALIAGGVYNVVGNGDRMRFQQVDWAPTSITEAANGFDITAGRGTVDLTNLAGGTPLRSDVVIPLDITASNVTVVIPEDVPVDIRADMTMGNLNEASGQRGGTTTRESTYNSDRPGSHLVVQIDGTFSNVTIQEGN